MPSSYHRNRFLLLCGVVVALVWFWLIGKWFGIPIHPGFEISLLRQPHALVVVPVVIVAILICAVVCTLIAGTVRSDAGLFCTALGLIALAMRGGSMRNVLLGASGSGVYFTLCAELLLLFGTMFVASKVIRQIVGMGFARLEDDFVAGDEPIDQKLIATATQLCATATLLLLLCRSDNRVQCLASVFVASLLASLIAVMTAPTRPAMWYWLGPMFVGLLGYLWPCVSSDARASMVIGQAGGYFAALGRPLPLHYASAGVGGAMLGYWFARSWHRSRELAEKEETATQAA
jgi:hypothetical protein